MKTQRVDYGIDAPGLLRMFFVLGAVALVAALVVGLAPWPGAPWKVAVTGTLVAASAYLLGMGCFMLYGSKVGKQRRRDRLLQRVAWAGTEMVLDVGCGRGLMMIGAAKRLTTGRAVGIDLWQAEDQSRNNPEAAAHNALVEGVADRVVVQTSDMRTLPFPDEAFDVIVSHWAVHNLYDPRDRATALKEMVRVLRPGGHLLLADIQHHDEYARVLNELEVSDVQVIENGLPTRLAAAVSFGSYRPATVHARK